MGSALLWDWRVRTCGEAGWWVPRGREAVARRRAGDGEERLRGGVIVGGGPGEKEEEDIRWCVGLGDQSLWAVGSLSWGGTPTESGGGCGGEGN